MAMRLINQYKKGIYGIGRLSPRETCEDESKAAVEADLFCLLHELPGMP